MQTKTVAPPPYIAERPRQGLAAAVQTAPVAGSDLPAVIVAKPVEKPFSSVDSLNREIAILNAAQPIALLGCAVAFGVTQAMNPDSWREALVCLAPFIAGIAGPMLAVAVESKRRAFHEARRRSQYE